MLNIDTVHTPSARAVVTTQSPCPCASGASFQHCCRPRLDGSRPAQTAEQLMRSRYTAHVLCEVDYLLRTWRPADARAVDPVAVRQWAEQSEWRGLTVHHSSAGGVTDDEGWVEFTAVYADKTDPRRTPQYHREKSRFVRVNLHWYYVDGDTREPDRPGRNSPCPCGSGRKFKRCCGA